MVLPKAAIPFHDHAQEYDSWFDSSPLFAIELAALKAIQAKLLKPGLEVGVGPGRFAQSLGIEFGIDPALSPLQLARHRSIIPINGMGEQLPVRSQSIGTIYLLFSLCFLQDPATAFKEFYRVLKPSAFLVVGLIPAESVWGRHLSHKGQHDHPFYKYAHFRTIAETNRLLAEQGFKVIEAWSTLFQPPSSGLQHEEPLTGAHEEAGFCVLTSTARGE